MDIWEKQLSRLNAQLDALTRHSDMIDSEAARMSSDIESFIATSVADSFKNRAVVSTARCTGDLFRELSDLYRLEVQISCLIQLCGQSCLERDNIAEEKDRVMKRIGVDSSRPSNVKSSRFTGKLID